LHEDALNRAIKLDASFILKWAVAMIAGCPRVSVSLPVSKASMTDRTQPEITRDTPLRLADAVKIAFPMGGMTVAGLRRERDRSRLIVEKIAGKEFTTLAHIERMRELCRDEARELGSSLKPPAVTRVERSPTKQPGSSETTAGMSAQAALQMRLRPRRES